VIWSGSLLERAGDEELLAPVRHHSAHCLCGSTTVSSSVPALMGAGQFGSSIPVVGSVLPTWTPGPAEPVAGGFPLSLPVSTDPETSSSGLQHHLCGRQTQFCPEVADDSPSASSRAGVRRGTSPAEAVQSSQSNLARPEADLTSSEKQSARHGRRSWQLARWGRRSRGLLEEKATFPDVPVWPKGSDTKVRGRCLDRGSTARLDEVDRLIARCMTHERPVALVQANAAILDACAERLTSEEPGSIAGGAPLPDHLRQFAQQPDEGRSDKIRRMLRLTDELRRRNAELIES